MTQANPETVTNPSQTQDKTIPFLPVKELSPAQWSTQMFIQEHQIPGIPVVLRHGVSEPEWNLEYLESKIGSEKFLCRFYGQERQTLDKRKWQTIGSGIAAKCLSFFEYASLVRSGEAHRDDIYLAKCPLATTSLANSPACKPLVLNLISTKP